MSKETDELTHKNAEDIQDIKLELGIARGISKWKRTVCASTMTVFLSGCYWLGQEMFEKFYAVKAGIIAFINALKSGQ